MVFRPALEPMLINAMMMVMEREENAVDGDGSSNHGDLY